MARPLHEFTVTPASDEEQASENWLTRTTARAFAAAISALLIATLVVNRSNEALATDGTAAGSSLSTGTISLLDDDSGRALFDFSDMAPGRPIIRCLEVIYDGTITPVDLTLTTESNGELAEFLDVKIEAGEGAGFESCDGFVPDGQLISGTLQKLSDDGRLDLGRLVNSGERHSYRITVDIRDVQDALGKSASADFIWEVSPS
ncbi:MAG: hypothetical protein R8J94_19925 [Acidimicrobiia bacterium]|nr:hypothetical protein [Acidimicrobiia bacterium]